MSTPHVKVKPDVALLAVMGTAGLVVLVITFGFTLLLDRLIRT